MLDGLACQRSDHVIGFEARLLQDGDPVYLKGAPYVRKLLRQIGRHLCTIGFVSAVRDLVEGLSFDVELANRGDGLGLFVTKCGRRDIKDGCEILRREICAQLIQHVDEDVCCRRGNASFGGHWSLPLHRVIGAEDERHGVDQEDS